MLKRNIDMTRGAWGSESGKVEDFANLGQKVSLARYAHQVGLERYVQNDVQDVEEARQWLELSPRKE